MKHQNARERLIMNKFSMISFQIEHFKKYNCFFPNTIIIANFDKKNYIVDGQHRISCIQRLTKTDPNYKFYVLVNTINVETIQELDGKYKLLTKINLFLFLIIWMNGKILQHTYSSF